MPARTGIKLDVALAQQQIGLGLDQRGLVAAIPQGAGAPVGAIDVLDVAAAHRDEQPRHRAGVRRAEEQMDVIGHQHVGVETAALPPQRLVQPAKIGVPVLLVEEAGATVVAPLHDM
jgi:hypothetical protein